MHDVYPAVALKKSLVGVESYMFNIGYLGWVFFVTHKKTTQMKKVNDGSTLDSTMNFPIDYKNKCFCFYRNRDGGKYIS